MGWRCVTGGYVGVLRVSGWLGEPVGGWVDVVLRAGRWVGASGGGE